MQNKFKEEDKEKVIKFLNMIAISAEFKLNTQQLIEYFKLLTYMQKELLPKIDDNILEVIAIHEADENSSESEDK